MLDHRTPAPGVPQTVGYGTPLKLATRRCRLWTTCVLGAHHNVLHQMSVRSARCGTYDPHAEFFRTYRGQADGAV